MVHIFVYDRSVFGLYRNVHVYLFICLFYLVCIICTFSFVYDRNVHVGLRVGIRVVVGIGIDICVRIGVSVVA